MTAEKPAAPGGGSGLALALAAGGAVFGAMAAGPGGAVLTAVAVFAAVRLRQQQTAIETLHLRLDHLERHAGAAGEAPAAEKTDENNFLFLNV